MSRNSVGAIALVLLLVASTVAVASTLALAPSAIHPVALSTQSHLGGAATTHAVPKAAPASHSGALKPISLSSTSLAYSHSALLRAASDGTNGALSLSNGRPSALLGTPGAASLAPRPNGLSTASNYYLDNSNCTFTTSVANAGGSSSNLVATGSSFWNLYNGTGGVPCTGTPTPSAYFTTRGMAEALHSSDGGLTWSSTYPAPNVTHWLSSGDATQGSVPVQFPLQQTDIGPFFLFQQPLLQPTYPGPVLAAGSDGTALEGAVFQETCTILGGTCTQPSGLNGTWGIAVARSADSGATWAPWTQVAAVPNAYHSYYLTTGECGATSSFWAIPFPANVPDGVQVAYSAANHEAVAVWQVTHWSFTPSICGMSLNWTDQYSISSDGGLTWSTPANLTADNTTTNLQVGIGPAPNHVITVFGISLGNSGVDTNGNLHFAFAYWNSSNNGVTWAGPMSAGNQVGTDASTIAFPDAFRAPSIPHMAVDNWSSSLFSGTTYVVWQDNQSGTDLGYPAIDFMKHTPAGLSWTTPIKITPAGHATTYFLPAISVAPNGTLWVSFIGVNQGNGAVRTYGTFSADGGTTWASPFLISDSASLPGATWLTMGQFNGAVATRSGTVSVWSDCRAAACQSSPFTMQLYAASSHEVTIASNISNVPATVTVFGQSSSLTLPATSAWDTGATVSISVPIWLPLTNTTDFVAAFQGFGGLSTSTTPVASFTYPGSGTLWANYSLLPSAWIAGTFYPYAPSLSPHLTINGQPVTLTPLNSVTATFNYTVASGHGYVLNATENRYQPILNRPVGVSPHATTNENASLTRLTGTISGEVITPTGLSVTPTVTINGTGVPVINGNFSMVTEWGIYTVLATATGLTSASEIVQVNPSTVTPVFLTLNGGWIEGNVVPAHSGLRVSVDGVPLAYPQLTAAGTFNTSVLGGTHVVTATQPGYNLTSVTVSSTPGAANALALSLTNKGWVQGAVTPLNISKTVSVTAINITKGLVYIPINQTDGTFNISLAGGYNWTINATAKEFSSFQTISYVSAGNTSPLVLISLSWVGCTGSKCGNNPPPNGGTPSGSTAPATFPYWVVAIAAGAVVAGLIGFLVMRRRGAPPSQAAEAAPEPPAEQLYGDPGQPGGPPGGGAQPPWNE